MNNYDLHIHMALDGADFRAALAQHRDAPQDAVIHAHLRRYRALGVRYLRDGGDRFGVCLRAKALAPEYGITYRTPAFPIYKVGHYGSFIGRAWHDLGDYRALLREAKAQGADFIKLMLTGLMDFSHYGRLTEDGLTNAEIQTLADLAHDMGFSVMAHCNGARAVLAAVGAQIESIEHGAYLNDDACHALAESRSVWIPTLSPVANLIGVGRFPDEALRAILSDTVRNVQKVAALGGRIGLGSDAGAYCVPHGYGAQSEYRHLSAALGENADAVLQRGAQAIQEQF